MELVTEPVNILVIDDDPGIRSVLSRAFQRAGHACVTAAGAAEGLDRAQESRPDLILLDIGLPDCDGRDVMGQLRANPAIADVPVIVISGYVDHYVRMQALEAGAHEVVEKPFDPVLLERRLSWLMTKRRAAASLAS